MIIERPSVQIVSRSGVESAENVAGIVKVVVAHPHLDGRGPKPRMAGVNRSAHRGSDAEAVRIRETVAEEIRKVLASHNAELAGAFELVAHGAQKHITLRSFLGQKQPPRARQR